MSQDNIKTTRLLKPKECLDGSQEWKSMTHAANIGAEIHVKPHLPGLIIFVHGVNSEGEWYEDAERYLCEGLNKRLNLPEEFKLEPNKYYENEFKKDEYNIENSRYNNEHNSHKVEKLHNSPVIRFYWGYRADEKKIKDFNIPLKNKKGDSYLRLEKRITDSNYTEPPELTENEKKLLKKNQDNNSICYENERDYYDPYLTFSCEKERRAYISQQLHKNYGPFYWNGGPFQNGTNQLISLWSKKGFNSKPFITNHIALPFDLQWVNPESDRLLTSSPPRNYYAHAVGRLIKLITMIRENNPHDTVSVISHSQGTMIALAAAAEAPPDALFVLNSPYALHDYSLNCISYPSDEQLSEEQRVAMLQAIVNKVATNKNRLKDHPCGASGLVVGLNEDNTGWSPNAKISKKKDTDKNKFLKQESAEPKEDDYIPERDNHGKTYIYCNPHDRVMGASPLRSIGWNGIPNLFDCKTKKYSFSPLLAGKEECMLYVRMLGRNMPCGNTPDSPEKPDESTLFCDQQSCYSDGTSFWENNSEILHYTTWPKPDANTRVYINAPEVPDPIKSHEMTTFDETFTNGITDFEAEKKNKGLYGYGFGQVYPDENKPIDADYYYLIDFYDYNRIQIALTPEEKKARQDDPNLHAGELNETHRFETLEECRTRFRTYIQRGTDHSSLPKNEQFLTRVVAYDLPIGYCEIGKNPEKMNKLRTFADWQSGQDDYMREGKLDIPNIPDCIKNLIK